MDKNSFSQLQKGAWVEGLNGKNVFRVANIQGELIFDGKQWYSYHVIWPIGHAPRIKRRAKDIIPADIIKVRCADIKQYGSSCAVVLAYIRDCENGRFEGNVLELVRSIGAYEYSTVKHCYYELEKQGVIRRESIQGRKIRLTYIGGKRNE